MTLQDVSPPDTLLPEEGRPGQAPALRRWCRSAVAFSNRLHRWRSGWVDWLGVPAQVCVADVQWIDEAGALRPHDLLARVHWRGVQGHLALSHMSAEAALAGHLAGVLWHELPPSVALALLQDGADRLTTLNPGLGPMRFQAMTPLEAIPPAVCAVHLRVTPEGSGEVIDLHWLVDPDAMDLEPLFQSPRRSALRVRREDDFSAWCALPVPVAFELGWVLLPLSELRGLRSEDVLLPDGWWAEQARGRVALRVGARTGWNMGYVGVLDEPRQRIKVTGRQEMERDLPEEMPGALGPGADGSGAAGSPDLGWEPAAQSPGASNAGASDLSALTDLPVRLTFDLGECSLTLQELAAVDVGYVFDLGLAPRSGVKLRVNGLRIGEGEIVEIDGRLGVAVTRILPPRA